MKWYSKILYAPIGWALHLLALMPWWVLYLHADVFYFFVYYLIGYRKKVVRQNLAESFPSKSDQERKTIEKEFYHHFTDYFVETIKLLHISDEEMRKRMVFHNAHVIDEAFDNNQSIILYAAHYGNWEWVTSVTLWFDSEGHRNNVQGQVYQPLENEWFDKFFLKMRQRFNTVCISWKTILREMITREREGAHLGIGFIADQHPQPNDQEHVLDFLNHPTAFLTGAEAIGRKLHCRAAFFDVRKVKRGHYECTLVPMSDDIAAEPRGSITTRYARLLEQRIQAEPSYWLWTHKRWKRPVTFPEGYNKDNEIEFYSK
ncbi:MAG: lysophospholipid acyltransferase family protein [Muribaculaceae bacterium]|nr:lysophospholipid acyltransferase family protein [Muribaculaceae bacterium]